MHGAEDFLKALSIVLCVAALTTVVFQKLKLPVVFGYLIAGLIIGPNVPIPLVAEPTVVHTLSELGVILLMFSLGLEFSFGRLFKVGPTAGITALIQCGLMIWLGFLVGQLFGWTSVESIFTGALIAISSTTIIAKAFDEQKIKGKLREIVVGILIVEDLIAILLLAILTAVSGGKDLSIGDLGLTVGKLTLFLVGLVGIGLLFIPRLFRSITSFNRPETTLVSSIGLCFAIALLAKTFGYSVALGAFLAGSLIAESGKGEDIQHLVEPVKNVFAAIFFVSVGMILDPALILTHWKVITVLTLVVVMGKFIGVTFGAILTGNGTRTSIQAGMSLAQIGEFSFIIAGLGLAMNATGTFLYPVAVAVSALTTLTTPWLIRASGPVAGYVDRVLPKSFQTFFSLYGSWIENLRLPKSGPAPGKNVARLVRWMILDAVILAAIVISASVFFDRIADYLRTRMDFKPGIIRIMVISGVGLLAVPFCVGILRVANRLGIALAERALPKTSGSKQDLAIAPRKALVIAFRFGSVIIIGLPLLAITQPFLPGLPGLIVFSLLVVILGFAFWRSTAGLQGHVRAGAQVLVEFFKMQSLAKQPAKNEITEMVRSILPGMGEPVSVPLPDNSPSIGKTLDSLNLRALTGATILAVYRKGGAVLDPSAEETLQEKDVLMIAGTRESLHAAKALLGIPITGEGNA